MVGKYPVTNEEFKVFVDEGGYGNKEYWTTEGWKWKEKKKFQYLDFGMTGNGAGPISRWWGSVGMKHLPMPVG